MAIALLASACSGHSNVAGANPQNCIDAWNDPANAANQSRNHGNLAGHVGMVGANCAFVALYQNVPADSYASQGYTPSAAYESRDGIWEPLVFVSRDLLPRALRSANANVQQDGTLSSSTGPFPTYASPVDDAPLVTLNGLRSAVDEMCAQDAVNQSKALPPVTATDAESLSKALSASRADLATKLAQSVRAPAQWQLATAEFVGSFNAESTFLHSQALAEMALAANPNDPAIQAEVRPGLPGLARAIDTIRAQERKAAAVLGLATCTGAIGGAPAAPTQQLAPPAQVPPTETQPAPPPFSNASFSPRVQKLVLDWSGGKGFPAHCLRYAFSTANPNWAVVTLNPQTAADSLCAPRAFDGVTIMQLRGSAWHGVIGGSDLGSNGYCAARVPAGILKSLRSFFHSDICLAAIMTDAFSSPTGNIRCHREASGIACGTVNNGRAVVLPAEGKPRAIAITAALSGVTGPALAYGKSWTNGPVTCSSTSSGVHCFNSGGENSGNTGSFEISAQGISARGGG